MPAGKRQGLIDYKLDYDRQGPQSGARSYLPKLPVTQMWLTPKRWDWVVVLDRMSLGYNRDPKPGCVLLNPNDWITKAREHSVSEKKLI